MQTLTPSISICVKPHGNKNKRAIHLINYEEEQVGYYHIMTLQRHSNVIMILRFYAGISFVKYAVPIHV